MRGENTLHLKLRVKKAEETMDGQHVHIDAVMFQVVQSTEPTDEPDPQRIVRVGLPGDNEKAAKEFAEHAMGSFQIMLEKQGFLPMQQKPFSAYICLVVTKEHYDYLGRPTVDDYIDLNARTDRRR